MLWSTMATSKGVRSPGRVTWRNRAHAPAPSTRAARYSWPGMFWSPASSSSVMNGIAFQASATRIMLSARNGSPSHTTLWSTMPSCTARALSTP